MVSFQGKLYFSSEGVIIGVFLGCNQTISFSLFHKEVKADYIPMGLAAPSAKSKYFPMVNIRFFIEKRASCFFKATKFILQFELLSTI